MATFESLQRISCVSSGFEATVAFLDVKLLMNKLKLYIAGTLPSAQCFSIQAAVKQY